jgi:hypothetical protein
MDFEYFLRLYKKNYHFSHINKFISAFRLHDSVKSFVLSEKQKIEHRNALLLHNEGLNKIKSLCGSYMINGRLLMDRPGSARLGGTGGMRHAIAYSAAVPLFFVADQLAREKFRTRDVLRVIIGLGMAMLLWRIFWRFFSQQQIPLYFGWYEGPLWFFMPLWLALILKRVRQTHMPMLVPIIFCIFFLIFSVLSPFRSRIYFAVASFAAVFWCFALLSGNPHDNDHSQTNGSCCCQAGPFNDIAI